MIDRDEIETLRSIRAGEAVSYLRSFRLIALGYVIEDSRTGRRALTPRGIDVVDAWQNHEKSLKPTLSLVQ